MSKITAVNTGGGGGASSNSFEIIQPDHGTSPTASSPTDTLTLTSSDASITITGNSATKTVNLQSVAGGGSVTSVGFTAAPFLIVAGAPVTTSGVIGITLAAQQANFVLAGPSSGSTATAAFRALVAGDIPSLSYVSSIGLTSGSGVFGFPNSPVTSSGNIGVSLLGQQANFVLAGPTSGVTASPAFRALGASDMPLAGYGPGQNYWSGFHDGAWKWTTTSSTQADMTIGSTGAFTKRWGNGLSVSTAASGLPGILFTPPSANAVYFAHASAVAYNSTSTDNAVFWLTDGTNTVSTATSKAPNITPWEANSPLAGIYFGGTTSPVTLKIQAAAPSGTATLSAPVVGGATIEWSIWQIF